MGRFDKYLEKLNAHYPELIIFEENKVTLIKGRIRIFDSVGEEWDNFDIKMVIPFDYPQNFPVVFETSDKLEKKISNHFFEDESCCLGWRSQLHLKIQGDYAFSNFIEKAVVPFFKQHVFKEYNHGKFINELTRHDILDALTFYINYFETDKWQIAMLGLKQAGNRRKPNDYCFCGNVVNGFKVKNKKCYNHDKKVRSLVEYCGKKILQQDFLLILNELKKKNLL